MSINFNDMIKKQEEAIAIAIEKGLIEKPVKPKFDGNPIGEMVKNSLTNPNNYGAYLMHTNLFYMATEILTANGGKWNASATSEEQKANAAALMAIKEEQLVDGMFRGKMMVGGGRTWNIRKSKKLFNTYQFIEEGWFRKYTDWSNNVPEEVLEEANDFSICLMHLDKRELNKQLCRIFITMKTSNGEERKVQATFNALQMLTIGASDSNSGLIINGFLSFDTVTLNKEGKYVTDGQVHQAFGITFRFGDSETKKLSKDINRVFDKNISDMVCFSLKEAQKITLDEGELFNKDALAKRVIVNEINFGSVVVDINILLQQIFKNVDKLNTCIIPVKVVEHNNVNFDF